MHLELVYNKNYFNQKEIFLTIEMAANETVSSDLKSDLSSHFWLIEKIKPFQRRKLRCNPKVYDIYKGHAVNTYLYLSMGDVYGESCLTQNILTDELNMGLPLQVEVE